MKIWAVFVHYSGPAGERLGLWIDSEWGRQASAIERSRELDRVMAAFSVNRHSTSVVEMSVVDVAIKADDKPKSKPKVKP